MKKGKDMHVYPRQGGGWIIIAPGNKRPTRVAKRLDEAMRIAQSIAWDRNGDVIVYGAHGRCRWT